MGTALSRTVVCVLLAGLLGHGGSVWAFRAANYFPLFNNPAASWTYSIPGVGTVNATVLLPTFSVNGVTVRAIQKTAADNSKQYQYYTNDANGIVFYQEFDPQLPTGISSPAFVDQTITFNPGVTFATAEMELGQTVNSSGTATVTFGAPWDVLGPQVLNYAASSTVQALNEPITVPAGTFNENVKVFTTLHIFGILVGMPFDATSTQTIWAVKDLGTVQEVDDGDVAHPAQLISSSVPALAPSISTVTFGRTPVGSTSAEQHVVLTNTGTTLNVSGPGMQISGDFALSSNTCGPVVMQGSPCTIGFTFTPTESGTRNGTALYFIQNDGNFPHQVINLVGGSFFTPRDHTGDGKSDLFWLHSDTDTDTADTFEWQMNGASLLAGTGPVQTVGDKNFSVKGIGDFDGDGKADVLWVHTDGRVYVWLMNGKIPTTVAYIGTIVGPWTVQGIGDFDGDGKADVLWRNSSSGDLFVWLMNGAGAYTGLYIVPTGLTLTSTVEGIGDFNGDGKADVLFKDGVNTSVWLNNGNPSSFALASVAPLPTLTWLVKGIGDFNGDGKSDILVMEPGSGTVYVWFMNGASASFSYVATVVGPWTVQGVGDYDGDGKADVFWRNGATTLMWLNNGSGTAFTYSPVADVNDLKWIVQNPK